MLPHKHPPQSVPVKNYPRNSAGPHRVHRLLVKKSNTFVRNWSSSTRYNQKACPSPHLPGRPSRPCIRTVVFTSPALPATEHAAVRINFNSGRDQGSHPPTKTGRTCVLRGSTSQARAEDIFPRSTGQVIANLLTADLRVDTRIHNPLPGTGGGQAARFLTKPRELVRFVSFALCCSTVSGERMLPNEHLRLESKSTRSLMSGSDDWQIFVLTTGTDAILFSATSASTISTCASVAGKF